AEFLGFELVAGLAGGPEGAGAVVGEEVGAAEGGDGFAAVDVAAGDGAALAEVVLEDGQGEVAGIAAGAGLEAVGAFHQAPAVVFAAGAVGRLEVDLFEPVLADVGYPHVAGFAVEREAPGVAEAVGPDFGFGAG